MWQAAPLIDAAFRRDPRHRALFMEILRQPRGSDVASCDCFNRYGILGRYLPAFGRIVGQMQHDLFHVYTVDEHILMVVRNLRRFLSPEFAHEYPLCSRLIGEFERPEVLYIAGLFHDIAKGRQGDHSKLGKKDADRFCRNHAISRNDTELITWLVENHLVMSMTAQKKDISDPDVIADFARQVGNERRLVALYLLTVADIRGTSPKVWNAWKSKLLEDLFRATRRQLCGEPAYADRTLTSRKNKVMELLQSNNIAVSGNEQLWRILDPAYLLSQDPQQIAWHAGHLIHQTKSSTPVVKTRIAPAGTGIEVLVYAADQKDLFARICSFFDRVDCNIVEARIHTTRHGYALDSFLVLDPFDMAHHRREVVDFIEHELAQQLAQHAPLQATAQRTPEPPSQAFSHQTQSRHRTGRKRRIPYLIYRRRRPAGTAVAHRPGTGELWRKRAARPNQYVGRARRGYVPGDRRCLEKIPNIASSGNGTCRGVANFKRSSRRSRLILNEQVATGSPGG